jgi:PAS domain S-box-containing protein
MIEANNIRRAEGMAQRLDRSVRTLSRCNLVLFRARSEQELLQSICQILVETGDLRVAWIGYCEDDADKTVRPVASAGHDIDLARVRISWGDNEAGRGPVGTAIRTKKPCWGRDPRTDHALSSAASDDIISGYPACVAFPLVADGGQQDLLELHGALTLHATSRDGFDEGDIERYADLAKCVTYAVTRLRGNLADDVILDVTALRAREERRRAGAALRASEERWRSVFASSSLGISLIDHNFKYLETNAAFQAMLGYTQAELQDLSPVDISADEEREGCRTRLLQLQQAKRRDYEVVTQYRSKKGNSIIVNDYVSTIPGKESDPSIFLVTSIDITARRRAEDALRATQSELARASRLTTMGELAASIAHEVNQPLMAIVTNAETCLRWLESDRPDLDEARQAAERIVRNGHRAADILRSIRGMARKSGPEMTLFDINDAVRDVLALIRGEMRRHDVLLETELFPDLGSIMGDRVQLQQVILNLIRNGIEAMSALTLRPRVLRVSTQTDEHGTVIIAVTDTGTGLDPAKVDCIYDPFFTTKPEGMGMGLSICRSIVEAHGGRLWASPNLPYGSVFRFTLPVMVDRSSACSCA